ncbi:X-ray repair cross-complementing protein 6 [Aedes aegypti]|uniref:ATP-dependent DNA helicase 2 subunit 1 n=1 Tax=Aedes aegypti TaxID=7159 RepID=A0A2C9GGD1_AEDAE|nr:X-ray repair cross-complementing protein 6 [Aedes aegypti]XP_021706757.1 X-ray repair cross-complementing protein 6 [Aedes aegypti]
MYWNPNHAEEEEDSQEYVFGGREGLLALIDCADYMFLERDDGSTNFKETLALIEAIMRNKIISSEKDLVGVVFYNTEHSPAPADEIELETGLVVPKKTAIYMPLSNPSADSIRKIINFKDSEDLDFDRKFGHSQDSNLSDVLWLCSRLFTRCGYKLEQSSIVLFTSNDEPHSAGSYEYQQCFVKAKDLQQLDINIVLIPMSEQFDGSKFYQEFLCTVADEDPDQFTFPCYQESREPLLARIFRRDFKKKALSHVKWQLSDDVSLGVNIYSLSRKTKYPAKVKLLRDTNEVIVSKRSYQVICADHDQSGPSSKPLLPGDQRKTLTIGGEKVSFSVDEVTNMKQMLQPGIQLLGFKPISKVSPVNHLRSSLFLYPDEGTISGSTVLFRALYEKCLAKQRAAFCMLTMRRKQPSKLVALIPQECCFNEDGEPYRHSGFRIEFIPYAADMRKLDVFEKSTPEVSQEQIDVFKSVAKKIKFKYHPSQFENPVLMTTYTNIEALLFDRHDLEVYDSTKPDDDRIDSKVGTFVDRIGTLFGEDITEAPKRRTKAADGEGPSSKAAKLDVDPVTIIEAIQSGKTGSVLVGTLRAYLQQQGVDGVSKLNKADLINKIKAHHNL